MKPNLQEGVLIYRSNTIFPSPIHIKFLKSLPTKKKLFSVLKKGICYLKIFKHQIPRKNVQSILVLLLGPIRTLS